MHVDAFVKYKEQEVLRLVFKEHRVAVRLQ